VDYKIEDRSFGSLASGNRRSSDETSQGHKSASTAESHFIHSLRQGEAAIAAGGPSPRFGGRASLVLMMDYLQIEDRIEEGMKSDEDGQKSARRAVLTPQMTCRRCRRRRRQREGARERTGRSGGGTAGARRGG